MSEHSEQVINRASFIFALIGVSVMLLAFLMAFPWDQPQTHVNNFFAAILFFACFYMSPAIELASVPQWFNKFRRIYYWVAVTMFAITLIRGLGLLFLRM